MSPSRAHKLTDLAELLCEMRTPGKLIQVCGVVAEATPSSVSVAGLSHELNLGDIVTIETGCGTHTGEVAAIRDDRAVVLPFERDIGTRLGNRVLATGRLTLRPHASWKGRTIDALGHPMDGDDLEQGGISVAVDRDPPAALKRERISQGIRTGVKVIDVFTPLCAGQRLGIFAGSGVGKSTLLAMLSRLTEVSTVIIALVGERGREVREFLEETLGSSRQNVIAVVATSDDSPMMRRLAPKTAMSIAEFFRDRGEHVLFIVDSLTRFAHAQREYALAAGEPPVARGFPPSVFGEIARLMERAGPGETGTGCITTIASVLVDGDDHNDPISDAVRGIIDGHIVLDRNIAAQGRFPAVDVLNSISRLAPKAWTPAQRLAASHLKQLMARFEETRDLRMVGGYQRGSDPILDKAVTAVPRIYEVLKQAPDDEIVADAFRELAPFLVDGPAPQQAASG